MSDNQLKDWLKDAPSRPHLAGNGGIKILSWRDWLHILNENPPEQTVKQRRNLLAISAISWLVWYGEISVKTISFFGTSITLNDPKTLYLFVVLLHAYFLITFIFTTLSDYIDKVNLRHSSEIKLVNNSMGFVDYKELEKEIERVAYKKALELVLTSKVPVNSYSISDAIARQNQSSITDFYSQKSKELESDPGNFRESHDKILKKLRRNLHIVWLKLSLLYLVPIIIGSYSWIKLLPLYLSHTK